MLALHQFPGIYLRAEAHLTDRNQENVHNACLALRRILRVESPGTTVGKFLENNSLPKLLLHVLRCVDGSVLCCARHLGRFRSHPGSVVDAVSVLYELSTFRGASRTIAETEGLPLQLVRCLPEPRVTGLIFYVFTAAFVRCPRCVSAQLAAFQALSL